MIRLASMTLIILISITQMIGMSKGEKEFPGYDSLWKNVEEFEKKGQPKSALKEVEAIYNKALSEDNEAQKVKTYVYRLKLSSQLDEDGLVSALQKSEELLAQSEAPARNFYYSIMAEKYAAYQQAFQYQINERHHDQNESKDDLRVWSNQQFKERIADYYQKSLSDSDLKDALLDQYKAVLVGDKYDREVRPTMYDVLLHRVFDYVQNTSSRWNVALKNDKTNLNTFIREKAGQRLADFKKENKIDALIDLKIRLLQWDKDQDGSDYRRKLQELANKYTNNKGAAQLNFLRIESLFYSSKNKELHLPDLKSELEQNAKRFPKSRGAELSNAFVKNVLMAKSLSFKHESIISADQFGKILVEYHNVGSVYIHIAKVEPGTEVMRKNYDKRGRPIWSAFNFNDAIQVTLPGSEDLRRHSTEIKLDPLPLGAYVLVVTKDKNINYNDLGGYSFLYSSNLAAIWSSPDVFVVDRNSGEPLKNVNIAFYHQDYDQQQRKQVLREIGESKTGANGHSKITGDKVRNVFIRVAKGKDIVFFNQAVYIDSRNLRHENHIQNYATVYTDRAIYRPGQTIHFKALAHQQNVFSKKWLKGESVEFELRDANHQLIKNIKGLTNEFGAFASSFKIPEEALPGRFIIQVKNGIYGNQQVQVEEYKRPQIIAEFVNSMEEYTLGDSILSEIDVATYFGSKIKDAKVIYKVSRVWFTPFYYQSNFYRGCYFPWQEVEEEVLVGETETDEKGIGRLTFLTEKFDVSKKFTPWGRYKVSATIISETGESVSVDKIYELSNSPYKIIGPNHLTRSTSDDGRLIIKAVNFDGQAVNKSFNYQWVKLESPIDQPYKNRLWQKPDIQKHDSIEFKKWFPREMYQDEGELWNWKKSIVSSGTIQVDGNTSLQSYGDLNEPGIYQLVISDEDGAKLFESSAYLYDSKNKTLPLGFQDYIFLHDSLINGMNEIKILSPARFNHHLIVDHLKEDKWINGSYRIQLEEKYRNRAFINIASIIDSRSVSGSYYLPYKKDQFLSVEIEEGWKEKMEPGEDITWTVRVKDKSGKPVQTELFLTVFDASLNAYTPHNWNTSILSWPHGYQNNFQFLGMRSDHANTLGYYERHQGVEGIHYPQLITFGMRRHYGGRVMMRNMDQSAAPMKAESESVTMDAVTVEKKESGNFTNDGNINKGPQPRQNLTEAAYFAHLMQTDKNGKALVTFTMSEALGAWETFILAVDNDFKYKMVKKEFTTSKPLLIQPYTPRFIRSDDQAQLSARLSNIEASDVQVTTKLELSDAITGENLNHWIKSGLGHTFLLPDNQTEAVDWEILVPNYFTGILKYVMSVKGALMRDAEVGFIPVITNRKLVTESTSIFLDPKEKLTSEMNQYDFHFSPDQTKVKVKLESVSQPLWYVFQALPHLETVDNESITQWVNTYFVNSIGKHSLEKFPWLSKVIAAQNDTSKLSLNQDLKNILTGLTPYQRDALLELKDNERFDNYFDKEKLNVELSNLISKIKKRQLSNGGFSWMPGGRDSWYMSQYVLLKMVQLQKITGEDFIGEEWAQNLKKYCDERLEEYYREYRKQSLSNKHGISFTALNQLYIDAILNDFSTWRKAHNDLWEKAKETWVDQSLMSQSMIAYILQKMEDDSDLLADMKKSFDERMIDGKNRGKFWKYGLGSRISEQDVLIHAHMMELYHELGDNENIPGLLIWLIQNKRTQMWKNKMSSIYAIQAILNTTDEGHDELQPIWVKLDQREYADDKNSMSASQIFEVDSDIKNNSKLEINNPNDHIGWINIYRQFEQDFDQIKAHGSESMKVGRTYWVKDKNSKVTPLSNSTELNKGDVILVKLRISSDRDMEYIALQDHRPAAFEPGVTLSGYQWRGGLSYYQATKDRETQFFIDYLPRGEHLIEYELTASHAGSFTGGLAEIQCLYAPEFRAFSQGVSVEVGK